MRIPYTMHNYIKQYQRIYSISTFLFLGISRYGPSFSQLNVAALQHIVNAKTSKTESPLLCDMTSQLECLSLQPLTLRPAKNIHPKEYKLPTIIKNDIKWTILDPLKDQRRYELPSFLIQGTEKFTPSSLKIVPIEDPQIHPHLPVIKKETMPHLINVRKRKMKKHKLKKFRKRMIFLHRKLTEIKKKRKEKALQAIERSFATSAREFDAEKYVAEHIKDAKRGGWKIDVIQRWQESKKEEKAPTDSTQ